MSSRWELAQQVNRQFWAWIASAENEMERILDENRRVAERLRPLLDTRVSRCLEIGIGGLGVGVVGFLPEIGQRIGMDPLPRTELASAGPIRQRVQLLREPIQLLGGCAESIPLADGCVELVVCCNVLDHVRDVDAVLSEIRRVLRPGGRLFLHVDTLSLAGLLKWHCWTRPIRGKEWLVQAHTYRFLERGLVDRLLACNFSVTHRFGHTQLTAVLGRARRCTFFAIRR